jgi:hypothetical protein
MGEDEKCDVKSCGLRLSIAAFALTCVLAVTGQAQTRDTYLRWEGGAAYYERWSLGPPSDQDYCTRGVWLQSPWNAPLFEGVGVNQYIGLYDGTVEVDPNDGPILPLLRDYKMPVFGDQGTGLVGPNAAEHLTDPIINAWVQEDEPDNAQSLPSGGYGDCVRPSGIVSL